MDDQLIIKLLNERSETALSELAEKYGGLCSALAMRILNDRQAAEECVNDAYLAVWDTVPPQEPASLSAYLCKITRNLALKRCRADTAQKRGRRCDLPLEELSECIPDTGTVESCVSEAMLTDTINRFLSDLKKIDRVIFVQRFWFCCEIGEIAASMGRSKNYVNVHLHRTKAKLKEYLIQEGYDVP